MTRIKTIGELKGKASILKDDDVRQLRRLNAARQLNVKDAALLYGVAPETIRRAVRGETFTHLRAAEEWTQEQTQEAQGESLARLAEKLGVTMEQLKRGDTMLEELKEVPAVKVTLVPESVQAAAKAFRDD